MNKFTIIKEGRPKTGRPFVLRTHPAIGDLLLTIPAAYALRDAGYDVLLSMELPEQYACDMTYPRLSDFNILPVIGETITPQYDKLLHWNENDWCGDDMVSQSLQVVGIDNPPTPKTACLTPSGDAVDAYREAYGSYVVCAPEGNFNRASKMLTDEHIKAAFDASQEYGYTFIVIGKMCSHSIPEGAVDLRHKTSVSDIVSLIAGSAAIITADSGPLHIAGALRTPVLILTCESHAPRGALANYRPYILLTGETMQDIPAQDVMASMARIHRAINTPWCVVGPDRNPCGVAETGRLMAVASGVPYVAFDDHDGGYCVAEYYVGDMDDLERSCKPSKTVLSLHRPERVDISEYAGAIYRSTAAYKKYSGLNSNSEYIPLHSLHLNKTHRLYSRNKFRIVWHGIIHEHKGLSDIVDAFNIARKRSPWIELHLVASVAHWWCNDELNQWLRNIDNPGITIDMTAGKPSSSLHEEFMETDAFIAFDVLDKEQSAAVPTVMGYGSPVIVSDSTAFDDVRGWCITATPDTLADEFVRLSTDAKYYNDAAFRSLQGAQFHNMDILAREYRAMVQTAILKGG